LETYAKDTIKRNVGMIDYHEQHAYAYDLFGFERRDEYEIVPLDI
jgi:hypothetical protein